MKMQKIALLLGGIVLVALICTEAYFLYFTPFSFGGNRPVIPAFLDSDVLLTQDQIISDRNLAIQFIEDVHPYFIAHDNLDAYEQAKQTYIDSTLSEMTVGAFQVATSEYLCFFNDGHTKIRWTETQYINLDQIYKDGKTYCIENDSPNVHYITHIENISIEDIYSAVDRLIPSENPMGQQCNRGDYLLGKNFLQYAANVNMAEDGVDITFSDGSNCKYPYINSYEIASANYNISVNTWQMDNDVFVIDFNECTDDENLKSIAIELESAIQQGCNKVIIDARGNGGGNSNACMRLLDAMDMTVPEYDVLIRYSPEAKEQVGYFRSSGIYQRKGSDKSKRNENVQLAVLCDRNTFSSANMLCVWVRDGGLGTIIGEPSPNSPNHYGDILYLPLPNSHIFATVSHKQFVRPDENNVETMLIPDIQTSSHEAYQKALEYLNQKKQTD